MLRLTGLSMVAPSCGVGPAPPRQTGIRSSSGFAPFRANTRFAVIGDSLTALGFYNDYYAKAVARFGAGFTGSYLNAGIAGNNISDINDRIIADIVNVVPQPTLLFVASARNDTGFSPAAHTALWNSVLAKAINGGFSATSIACIGFWLSTEISPDPDPATPNGINSRIAACAAAVGATCIDIRTPVESWELINNPVNPNPSHLPQVASGLLTSDGTHPNSVGLLWPTPYFQAAMPYA